MNIGVALVPREDQVRQLIRIQQKVQHVTAIVPILGEDENLPHVTLLQGEVPDDVVVEAILNDIVSLSEELPVTLSIASPAVTYQDVGWFFLGIVKNPSITAFHNVSVKRLQPLLLSGKVTENVSWEKYTDLERANYLRYGYRYIGDLFQPHITLGRSQTEDRGFVQRAFEEARVAVGLPDEIRVGRVTIYLMGRNGAHATTLAEHTVR